MRHIFTYVSLQFCDLTKQDDSNLFRKPLEHSHILELLAQYLDPTLAMSSKNTFEVPAVQNSQKALTQALDTFDFRPRERSRALQALEMSQRLSSPGNVLTPMTLQGTCIRPETVKS